MNRRAFGRKRRLATADLRGRFIVSEGVVEATERALRTFRDAEGDHEGIVFWGGLETERGTFFLSAVVPVAEHSPGSVHVDEAGINNCITALHDRRLGLLAQVHSHPGTDARHSEGDDRLVLMPFDGMLSVVVPYYAHLGMRPLSTCAIHQYQDGQWKLCVSGLERLAIAPSGIDLR